MRASSKLLLFALASIIILPVNNLSGLGIFVCFVVLAYFFIGKSRWKKIALIKPLLPILFIILVYHSWVGNFAEGVSVTLRLAGMVLLANIVTITTRMTDMMSAIEPLLRPVNYLGLSSRQLSLAVSLCLRFVTVLFALWEEIEDAYKARTGKKRNFCLLSPFCIQVIKLAELIGDSLTARGGASGFKTINSLGNK